MLVADDLEVLILVVEQGIGLTDLDGRVRVGLAAQLLKELVDVDDINLSVAACPDEFARLEPGLLRHHHGEQRVGGDIERHAEEHVAGTLVQLAA